MLDKFERALDLGGACWKALMLDKEMLLFPILSLLALASVLGGIFAPAFLTGNIQHFIGQFQDEQDILTDPRIMAVTFLTYFCAYFVMTFFNAALLSCSMIRFAGGDPTVMDGLRASCRNLPQILLWALFCATIGFLIHMIASRFKGIGRWVADLMGAAWAVASYFAIPVLVVEGVGPFTAVKQSISILRKTWGEALIGVAGLGALNWIGIIFALPLILWGGYHIATRPELAIVALSVGFVWAFIVSLVVSTLSTILKAALYVYAYEGKVPANFQSRHISGAFLDK